MANSEPQPSAEYQLADPNRGSPGQSVITEPAVAGIDSGLRRIVTVVILGSIMAVLDTTIVNVALKFLSRDLHTQLVGVQWVVTAYLLSLAAVIPVSAWAARRFGAKRLYLASITLFTVGSILCGLANSATELIVFRAIQGLGGGFIMPVGMMILVRAAGRRNVARAMSAMAIPTVIGPVMGPALGGILLDNVGWRWIFFVNVPVGVVAVLVGLRRLPVEPAEDAGPIDLLGLMAATTGLVLVTYGLAEVGLTSGADVVHVWLPLVTGALVVGGFVRRALRTERPLLDVRLYADKGFTAASVTMFCVGVALFGGMILMPLYFQTVRHEDAVYTGLLLVPRGLGAAVATWMTARASERLGAGTTSALGAFISAASVVPFTMIGSGTSYLAISVVMFVGGFGLGLAGMPAMTAAYRALRSDQVNDATSQMNIVLRVGGSIGTAILAVVLQHHLSRAHSSSAQAHAFASTFWWVLAVSVLAVVPTVVLALMERRMTSWADDDNAEDQAEDGAVRVLEAG